MTKDRLSDYLIVAINIMIQDKMCYNYTPEEALHEVLLDLGMAEDEYEKLLKPTFIDN